MDVLTLATRPATEQIAALEKGLPSNALTQIATALGMPKTRMIQALRFAQRSVTQREKAGSRFTMEESERLLRIVRVRQILQSLFTSDEAIAEWLLEPDRSLGGRAPLDLLATDIGTAKVENLAHAMIHGVPA